MSNTKSKAPITIAKIIDATKTKTALFCRSLYFGHETLFFISSTVSNIKNFNFCIDLSQFKQSTGGETRTPSQRFWRPLLYQLSYTRVYAAQNGLQRYYLNFYNTNAFHTFFLKRVGCLFFILKLSLRSR